MKKILYTTIIILIGIGLLWGVNQSMVKSEKLECQKWKKWEDKYNISEWASWQYQQCDRFQLKKGGDKK